MTNVLRIAITECAAMTGEREKERLPVGAGNDGVCGNDGNGCDDGEKEGNNDLKWAGMAESLIIGQVRFSKKCHEVRVS